MEAFILKNNIRIFLYLFVFITSCSFENDPHVMYDEHRYQEAIPVLLELVKKDSSDFDNLLLLADCYHLTGDYPKGIKYYKNCENIQPDHVLVLTNLGDCYYQNGEIILAENMYKKGLKINPHAAELLYNMGLVELDKKNFPLAIQYLFASVEEKEFSKGYWTLSDALQKNNEFEAALDCINTAIRLDSTQSSFYFTKGIIERKKGNLAAGISSFTKVISMDSLNAESYFNRASCYYLENKMDEACKDLHASVRLGMKVDSSSKVLCK